MFMVTLCRHKNNNVNNIKVYVYGAIVCRHRTSNVNSITVCLWFKVYRYSNSNVNSIFFMFTMPKFVDIEVKQFMFMVS